MIRKSFKFRLLPNKTQRIILNKNLGCCRWIYNYYLGLKQDSFKNKTEYVYVTESTLKQEFEWLKESESTSLQQARQDVYRAYQNFFRKIKQKQKTALKFKSKKNTKSSFRIQATNTRIQIKNNKIKIPKHGWFKFIKSQDITGKIKNITVTKSLNKWYISINVEIDENWDLPKNNNKVGIDLGLKEFAVTSDGEIINNPRYFRNTQIKLARFQRKLSKKKKGSKNRYKSILKVTKIHEKIKNQRFDFLHKLSTKLINENQVICLEDLNVKGMIKNHKLAKSISDASWSIFVGFLEYKARWYGREILKVDRFFPSSKLCSNCGNIQDMPLNNRVYKCSCGLEIDRDLNASINILKQGTVGTTGLACGDSCGSMKQESLSF